MMMMVMMMMMMMMVVGRGDVGGGGGDIYCSGGCHDDGDHEEEEKEQDDDGDDDEGGDDDDDYRYRYSFQTEKSDCVPAGKQQAVPRICNDPVLGASKTRPSLALRSSAGLGPKGYKQPHTDTEKSKSPTPNKRFLGPLQFPVPPQAPGGKLS